MKEDGWKLAFLVMTLAFVEYFAWNRFADVIVNLYLLVFVILVFARVFNWPRPAWFHEDYVEKLQQKLGTLKLEPIAADTPVAELRTRYGVKPYFESVVCKENTVRLCSSILESLTPKILIYGGVAFIYMFLAHNGHTTTNDKTEVFLKSNAIVAISFGPLLWDYARCERQKFWNKELREP